MIFKEHKEHKGIYTNYNKHIIKSSDFGYESLVFYAVYGNLNVSYKIVVEYSAYNTAQQSYRTREKVLLETSKYTDAFGLFAEIYDEMANDYNKKANRTWSDIIDNVMICNLLEQNHQDLDVYYYNIFERYIIKNEQYVIAHMENHAVAYIIDDNGIFLNKDFVDSIKHDDDSFSEYIRLYAKHINKGYGKLEIIHKHNIITNMHGQSIQYDIHTNYFDKYKKISV
jgi:hypothetical protein